MGRGLMPPDVVSDHDMITTRRVSRGEEKHEKQEQKQEEEA
jgi:hypothetical protein